MKTIGKAVYTIICLALLAATIIAQSQAGPPRSIWRSSPSPHRRDHVGLASSDARIA